MREVSHGSAARNENVGTLVNERTLSETSWRQQEHFLAIGQVPDKIAELVSAVDEIGVVDDFAKNEGIFLGRS
jgi:hypothetical protein